MKASHSVLPAAVIFSLCLSASLFSWKAFQTNAQNPCTTPPILAGQPKWKAGAVVSVYYRQGDFNATEKAAIERAIDSWNVANGPQGNNSGVFIGGYAETTSPASAFNCLGPGCPSATLPVMYVSKDTIQSGALADTQNFGNQADGDTHLAIIRFNSNVNFTPVSDEGGLILTAVTAHEVGHTFKLDNCIPACNGTSVMGQPASNGPQGPTPCDNAAVNNYGNYPTPTPTPTCPDADGDGLTTCDGDCNDSNPSIHECEPHCVRRKCSPGWSWWWEFCQCVYGPCPIVIDTVGDGYKLTNNSDGVNFDLDNNGWPETLSWIAAGTDDAWLALDRNNNGTIDNGAELFGNFTPQPASNEPNGFLALGEFDDPGNGGNGDDQIDSGDAIWWSLRLWQDGNHNGISEPWELHTLKELDVETISLDVRESRQRDRHGNVFRYRAKVYGANRRDLGRWAYDVFLVP